MNAKLAKFITAGLVPLAVAISSAPIAAAYTVSPTKLMPQVKISSGAVVLVALHGFGLSRDSYVQLAKQLQSQGIIFEALDVRGFGKEAAFKLDFQKAANEISEHLAALRARYPNHKLILLGESMGGALALKVAAENSDIVDGVVASEPAYKVTVGPLTYPKVVLSLLVRPNAQNRVPLGFAKRVTTMEPLLSNLRSKLKNQRGYSAAELWNFRALMKSVPAKVAQLCQTPILFLQGDSDRLVNPAGTSTLSRIGNESTHELVILKKRGHLLLEENQTSDEAITALNRWIAEQVPSNQQVAKGESLALPKLISITNPQTEEQ